MARVAAARGIDRPLARLRRREDADHGVTPPPAVFALLLVAAAEVAAAGLLVASWGDGATGWAALGDAAVAAGLALWAMVE